MKQKNKQKSQERNYKFNHGRKNLFQTYLNILKRQPIKPYFNFVRPRATVIFHFNPSPFLFLKLLYHNPETKARTKINFCYDNIMA